MSRVLALGRPVARYVAVPVRSVWGFAEIKECSELHKGRCGILAKQIASNIIKHSIFVSRKSHEITLDWDRPACRTAADLVLFWKVKNINVNALGWSPLNIRQLCMRYDGVELSMSTRAMCKKRRINSYIQLPTSAQSELTATLSLLRIIILKTSYIALSIWPIDRPSRKDFLVAIVLEQLNNCCGF